MRHHEKIARASFPDGAILTCTICGIAQRATTTDCATYLATGWPVHCHATMRSEASPLELPLGDAPKGRTNAIQEGR